MHELSNMNEIREVAKAYYNGAQEGDKNLAQQFFKSLDENGDGKVSLQDFKKKVDPSFSNDEIFRKLDGNGDGTLDFEEVLALYYMNKVSIPRCSACGGMLLTAYFSCLRCEGKTSYRLCCNCYTGGRFEHHHSPSDFADTRALLKLLEQLAGQAQLPPNLRDILQEVQNNKANPQQSSSAEARNKSAERIVKVADEATNMGIDEMIDAADGVEGGIDMIDIAVEVGTQVASFAGCTIM